MPFGYTRFEGDGGVRRDRPDDGLRAGLLPAPQALALVLALLGRAPRHRLHYLRVPTLRDAGDHAVGNILVNTICP